MRTLVCLAAVLLVAVAWYALAPKPSAEPPGRWRAAEAAGQSPASAADRALIERLEAIGYAAGSIPATDRSGVTRLDPQRAQSGLNLAVSGHAPEATLLDMQGVEVHRWHYPFDAAFPEARPHPDDPGPTYWRHAHLLPDGGLLAIFEGLGLIRLDRDSKLLWAYDGKAHHDLAVAQDGRITLLTRRIRRDFPGGHPVLDDSVTVLGADGRELTSRSLLEAYRDSSFASDLDGLPLRGEPFHTNTVEVLDGSHVALSPAFARGNMLLSMRMIDTIAVLDPASGRIVWRLRGGWDKQHQPTLLPSGRMLIFDNRPEDGRSRILEFTPTNGETVWQYGAGDGEAFFSRTCGSVQRLANGNTLVTESDNGRAFEVTRDGDIVWEYVTPHRVGSESELIATLFEVLRLPPDFPTGWLDSATTASAAAYADP